MGRSTAPGKDAPGGTGDKVSCGGGCRSWLVVDRDTQTHEIFAVTTARDFARKQNKKDKA